jgi:hypothetical protein
MNEFFVDLCFIPILSFFKIIFFFIGYFISLPITKDIYCLLKGGMTMENWIFLFLASILAGFALINVPLAGTFLASLTPFTTVIGVLTVLIFSLVLVYKGVRYLFNK